MCFIYTLSTYPFVNGHLGSFHLLSSEKNVAMDPFQSLFLILSGPWLGVEFPGHMATACSCVCISTWMCTCVCTHIQRPEADVKGLPRSLPFVNFDAGSLSELGTLGLS